MIDQADLQSVAGEAGDVVQVELAHKIRAVVVDRLDADVQLQGDLLCAVAFGDKLKDFTLAVGQ